MKRIVALLLVFVLASLLLSVAVSAEPEQEAQVTIFLTRHGKTLFNTEHRVQGWCDTPLTEGTHYTAVIKKGDDVVSEVKDVGDYSLTITAKDGSDYTGYQILNFSVVDIQNVLSVDNDFTEEQDGYYYLNMPARSMNNYTVTLPEGFTSAFKVYDDGGKNSNYSANCNGTLVLTAPAGYVLQLSGSVTTQANYDYLDVYRMDREIERDMKGMNSEEQKAYLMEYMGWTDEPEPEGSQDWLSMEDTDYTPF